MAICSHPPHVQMIQPSLSWIRVPDSGFRDFGLSGFRISGFVFFWFGVSGSEFSGLGFRV